MGNKIVHIEFMGADGKAQQEFYSGLFGWDAQAVPGFDDYFVIDGESSGVGAAVGKGPEDGPNYLTVYIEVDSIDGYLGKIEGAGGHTVMPRTVVPDVVTFAMFTDPAGNVVGLVEADSDTPG